MKKPLRDKKGKKGGKFNPTSLKGHFSALIIVLEVDDFLVKTRTFQHIVYSSTNKESFRCRKVIFLMVPFTFHVFLVLKVQCHLFVWIFTRPDSRKFSTIFIVVKYTYMYLCNGCDSNPLKNVCLFSLFFLSLRG